MSLRGLFCVALLLVSNVMAQQNDGLAATPQAEVQSSSKPNSAVTEIKVECLPASRAAELLGKHGCIAGKVFHVTSPENGSTHISLCPPKSDCSFYVVVFASDRENVGNLSYLQGKLVAFIGNVTNYRGHPEIVVKDRRQVHVSAGNPPPQFDAAQSKASSSGQGTRSSTRTRAW